MGSGASTDGGSAALKSASVSTSKEKPLDASDIVVSEIETVRDSNLHNSLKSCFV